MRVISGTARGTRLAALEGEDITRPTMERVKEGMFSSIQFLLPGARVLDLFGGSGQLGIEAASRGAARVDIVDSDASAVRVIEHNVAAAKVGAVCRVHRAAAEVFLNAAVRNPATRYTLAILDPPFRKELPAQLLPQLAAVLEPGAVVLVETEQGAPLPEEEGGLRRVKQYRYGKIAITRYEKGEV